MKRFGGVAGALNSSGTNTPEVATSITIPQKRFSFSRWLYALIFRRLDQAFLSAPVVPVDDASRIVLFSDCHRGNNGRSDGFARNRSIFLRALDYYYSRGYTYIEVGDGDELWQNRHFHVIREAHRAVFERLHRFYRENRLYLLFGNHDVPGRQRRVMEKDGIPVYEGLVLQHQRSGQEIFVVHGHQADLVADRLMPLSRMVVRYVARYLRGLGIIRYQVKEPAGPSWADRLEGAVSNIEKRLMAWATVRQRITICGHTHRPVAALPGMPPYFNTGSCVFPGFITGLEIENGYIRLIKWVREHFSSSEVAVRVPLSEPVRLFV